MSAKKITLFVLLVALILFIVNKFRGSDDVWTTGEE
jgi:hypothetical protein